MTSIATPDAQFRGRPNTVPAVICRGRRLVFDRPAIMGILNITPDSFSDGGRLATPEDALAAGLRMLAEGATMLDVGGESTRPGARCVDPDEEIRRVVPVIRLLAGACDAAISVDTRKAAVAEAALEAGACIVNDVSALAFDPRLAEVVRRAEAGLILMHSRGTPETMETLNRYVDIVADVRTELAARVAYACAAGIARENLIVDPGFGFAKSAENSLRLLDHLDTLVDLAPTLAVGLSRKRLVAAFMGRPDAPTADRDAASAELACRAIARGARIVRTHAVALTRSILEVPCF